MKGDAGPAPESPEERHERFTRLVAVLSRSFEEEFGETSYDVCIVLRGGGLISVVGNTPGDKERIALLREGIKTAKKMGRRQR